MEHKNLTERAFVRRVTAVSVSIALILLALLGAAWQNKDTLYGWLAGIQAGSGSFEAALKTAGSIEDPQKKDQSRYRIADAMDARGEFAEAAELFGSLGDFSDSRDRCLGSRYAAADDSFRKGDYEAALEAFGALGSYGDSPQRQKQTIYAMAEAALQKEDLSGAMMLYLSAGDWGDSREKAYETACALTGDPDRAKSMLESGGQSPETLQRVLNIAQRRSLFPETVLAAGAYHTAVLYPDGTVAACGDNSFGQCDVQSWRDIVQIAAGAYHTVGLKKDGTVVAAGKNDEGQCAVEELSGIVQIACGDSDTYALTREGTVRMAGSHSYGAITDAVDVKAVFAGSYGAVVQTGSGAFLSSHRSFSRKPDSQVLSLGLQTGNLLTQYLDGTLTSQFDLGGDWENIVWFDAGPNGVIASDLDGRVRAHFFREPDAIDFSQVRQAAQCAAGAEHYVFLLEDGTFAAFGDNRFGQCDVDALGSVKSKE